MSDPLKELCDYLKTHNMRFVFWTCPDERHRLVKWDHTKEGSVATCVECGWKSTDPIHPTPPLDNALATNVSLPPLNDEPST